LCKEDAIRTVQVEFQFVDAVPRCWSISSLHYINISTPEASMWLLNTSTLSLIYVNNLEDYSYAILSHTWGNDEVSFQEITNLTRARWKTGFSKIKMTCQLARQKGIGYAWIDTCCIDKSSSAELSEAINSMFLWYQKSVVCFVHLEDLPSATYANISGATAYLRNWAGSGRCRWFTRGWTLQELIAPENVEFYDMAWNRIGNKADFVDTLAQVTRIPRGVLNGTEKLRKIPVGSRIAWAAGRETTRVEDRAYCLLGIFDINMPLLYGEGARAFLRLQQEIAKETNDMSLFAWQQQPHYGTAADRSPDQVFRGIFAESPEEFEGCSRISKDYNGHFEFSGSYTITNNGLLVDTPLADGDREDFILNLCCSRENDSGTHEWVGIRLTKTPNGFVRSSATDLFAIPSVAYFCGESASCYIKKVVSKDESREIEEQYHSAFSFNYQTPHSCVINLLDRQPARFWDVQKSLCITRGHHLFIGYQHFSVQLNIAESSQVQSEFVLLFGVLVQKQGGIEHWVTIYNQEDDKFKTVMENLNTGGKPSPGDLLSAAQVIFPNFSQSGRKVEDLLLNTSCRLPVQIPVSGQKTLLTSISSSKSTKYNCSVYELSISFEVV
jgi:hypothetical protein